MLTDKKPFDPYYDGVTHINIYSKGRTHLGRMLSNFAPVNFKHPIYGHFRSIEGLWYYLLAPDVLGPIPPRKERLRVLTGYEAKKLGRELTKGRDWSETPSFIHDILLGLDKKSKVMPGLRDALKKANPDLPFVHYYVFDDKVIEPESGKWILRFWEDERKKLQGIE